MVIHSHSVFSWKGRLVWEILFSDWIICSFSSWWCHLGWDYLNLKIPILSVLLLPKILRRLE